MRSPSAEELVDRAREALAKDDLDSILRAALHLRMAVEAITYRKLKGYSKYVPASVLKTWQPAHAMKMLLQFEPEADQNCHLYVGLQKDAGIPAQPTFDMGEHRTFDVRWLQRNYHRLGSYLHYPIGDKPQLDLQATRGVLVGIADEVASIADSPVYFVTMAARVSFECQVCGTRCMANVDGIRTSNRAVCVNPECGAVHDFEESDDSWLITLAATEFKCLNCEHIFGVENRFLKIGYEFVCPECSATHALVQCRWGYGIPEASR
jgi:DNA-directed RNA polymerase subunit RPC12/RpoP